MVEQLILVFIYITGLASVLAGVANALLFYSKGMMHFHPSHPLSKREQIIASISFGVSSAISTFGFIVAVGAVVYPFFRHAYLLD